MATAAGAFAGVHHTTVSGTSGMLEVATMAQPIHSYEYVTAVGGASFRQTTVVMSQSGGRTADGHMLQLVESQKAWFFRNRKALESAHLGYYVAVYEDSVVDSDRSLAALVNRFFSNHAPVDVYFGFVGKEPHAGVGSI